jgi:hypothetical protein
MPRIDVHHHLASPRSVAMLDEHLAPGGIESGSILPLPPQFA